MYYQNHFHLVTFLLFMVTSGLHFVTSIRTANSLHVIRMETHNLADITGVADPAGSLEVWGPWLRIIALSMSTGLQAEVLIPPSCMWTITPALSWPPVSLP